MLRQVYTRFAPYGASEVVQSTVRRSEATLKGILKVLLQVFSKVQSGNAQPICVFERSAEQSMVFTMILKA